MIWKELPSVLICGLEFHASHVICSYCPIETALVIGRIEPHAFPAPVNVVSIQEFTLQINQRMRRRISPTAAQLSLYFTFKGIYSYPENDLMNFHKLKNFNRAMSPARIHPELRWQEI